ncbi:3-phosphoshikimate 1-carboxyvinyltransferase [Desulfurivibrio alkaliphilus]|uniref:3-phosphoshikimate 1-carboxyvinyltransferase n=1 Tax=Desulfurivibrio alkaliphilus (strain DSM 19089 / UNIQEM U267 / AHT2) TaxID=589865 RepID=D6Z568_DESAT|nr:3-phosphoshikimate 1-carboxyvinyltransferase [Desulfurivibrio alkaliphilus]ADH84725.1 3-phosphoshikimate 1-carboxyvinyltransferase [Desulfurivibrio alkaliphilus AHT 2]
MKEQNEWQEITPCGPITAAVEVPGSKSITQRALIAAALAKGESILRGPLASEDTDYTTKALLAMGMVIDTGRDKWRIFGQGGRVAPPATEIYLGNNGTATRFLTSVAALGRGIFLINGDERMQQRPIEPLLQALRGWGVQIRSIQGTGCPPLEIQADGLAGGATVLPEGKSSQYLSSLLLVSPYARQPAELKVEGEVLSKPYVAMTLAVMRDFGIEAEAAPELNHFKIPQGIYQGREYRVEGDASSASYFWAAAAVTGGKVTVTNVPSPSLQGDAVLVDILEQMGCRVERDQAGISVAAPDELRGVEVDMGDCPDVVPTLAVVAALAQGRTRINNIAHLRIKECDRLGVMAAELAKLGVKTEEGPDYLVVEGRGRQHDYQGAEIATHNDHRIAMSFAVASLAIPGIRIENPGCVKKSFPDFWQRLESILP